MAECKAFVRRSKPYGRNILCHEPAIVEVVTTGKNGERIVHGHHCPKHAKRLAGRFSPPAREEVSLGGGKEPAKMKHGAQSGISVTRGPRKFTVRERVVFEYVWRIRATSKADARRVITEIGDGEASEQNEGKRSVVAVKDGWEFEDSTTRLRDAQAGIGQRTRSRK